MTETALVKRVFGVTTFNIKEEALVALAKKHKSYEIVDYKSYQAVVAAIAEVRGWRGKVETHRKELKADILEEGRSLDGAAKKITERLWQIENPLKELKKVEDDKKEAAAAEKERLEKVRVAEIQLKITSINNMVTGFPTLNKDQLLTFFGEIEGTHISEAEYQEFTDHAKQVKAEVLEMILKAIKERVKLDQEAADRKAEGERLAKEREAQRVEAERLEQAEIAQREQAAKERARIELERKKQQDILEAQRLDQEKEAEQKAAAEDSRRDAEKAKILKERKKQEAALKAEQDRLDIERREIEEEKAKIEADKKAEKERKEKELAQKLYKEKQEKEAKERTAAAKIQAEKDAKEKAEQVEKDRIAKEKADKEEAERQEALKPDKQKLLEMADMLEALILPNILDKEAEAIRFQTRADLDVICEKVRRKVDTL